MKNVKIISSGFTLQIGREFDILSLFLILSRQKCMIIYGGQIPESFAKSKSVWYEAQNIYIIWKSSPNIQKKNFTSTLLQSNLSLQTPL